MKTKSLRGFLFVFFIMLCHAVSGVDTNKSYYIFHSSGLVLAANGSNAVLQPFTGEKSQQFNFAASGNSYLIKNVTSNNNVTKTGDWNTEFSTSTSDVARFSIEEAVGEYIKFRCAQNSRFLGTDNTTSGSNVYSDKDGSTLLHYWYLRDASGNELITEGLEAVIREAEDLYNNTREGDNEGEFSVAVRSSLSQSIITAKTHLDEATAQQEINTATLEINEAIVQYKQNRNSAFKVGEKYYIMHASNRFLCNVNDNPKIKDRNNAEDQQFTFVALSDGSYAIQNVANGKYLNSSGEYSAVFSTSNTASTAHLIINYAPNEELYVRIQFKSNNLFLGTDGTTDNQGVYSDKKGDDGKHYWHLIRVDQPEENVRTKFHNGSSALRLGMNWNDANGKHINVHGGCVLYENGTYYWFGENYRTSGAVKSNGIGCYTSKDLYNWKFERMAYECPNQPLRDDMQDMNYGRTLERPKVMYCPNTGQYVMWVHWENGSGYAASRVAILYSDEISGPYTFVKTMRPRGDEQPSGSRDQTLMFDPDYNAGYHFGSAEENATMHATVLTNDYLDLSSTWARLFISKQYEAPAVFKFHGRFVAITSGCTGWNPNPGHSSMAELPLGNWTDYGNPFVDKDFNTSYNSQSNYIFKVPGKYDAYIYMGDRWKGGDYFSDANVGESWHIWLPIDMRAGYPIIRFYSEWDLSLFDKINRYRRVKEFEVGKEYVLLSKNANKIFSEKDGKFIFGADNDETNISFQITKNDEGYYILTDSKSGRSLHVIDGLISMTDSTGSAEQQWKIVSTGGNDGYYYFYPRNDNSSILCNYCATTTIEGAAGIISASKQANCQIAFCFDSKKHDYKTISDESDGSYKKWMEETLHFKHIDIDPYVSVPEFRPMGQFAWCNML